jgi:hypothetical protein
MTITIKIWNRGAVLVVAGVPVSVRQGAGGPLLGITRTAGAIVPGSNETVTITVKPPPTTPTDLVITANDDESGQAVVNECDRTNNAATLKAQFCGSTAQ